MYKAVVITVSDKGSAGLREDTSGPVVKELLEKAGYSVGEIVIIPDEMELIKTTLINHCEEKFQLIVTTGGTGFSKRDVTPEATIQICERIVPGIPEAMRAESLKITNRAVLSRAASGIRGETLIINLPGSPKAAKENLLCVLDAIEHGLDILTGNKSECGVK